VAAPFEATAQGVWRRTIPVGWGPGEAAVGGLGDKVPQTLKQFGDIVYRF